MIHTRRVGRCEADYADNLGNVLEYSLKGAQPAVGAMLDLLRCTPQGTVIGKRAGCSQNIGPGARAKMMSFDKVARGLASGKESTAAYVDRNDRQG